MLKKNHLIGLLAALAGFCAAEGVALSADSDTAAEHLSAAQFKAARQYGDWVKKNPGATPEMRKQKQNEVYAEANQLWSEQVGKINRQLLGSVLKGAAIIPTAKGAPKHELAKQPAAAGKPGKVEERKIASLPNEDAMERTSKRDGVASRKADIGPVNSGSAESVSFSSGGGNSPSFGSAAGAESVSFNKKRKKNND